MLDQELIKEQLYKWMTEFVEVPNPKLGNWAPCPYARQARINNKIKVAFSEAGALAYDVYGTINCLDEFEVLIICFDHNNISPVILQEYVDVLNRDLMPKNYVILVGHPDIPEYVSGVRMNFDTCGILVIQKLDALNMSADRIRYTGYFEHWDQHALNSIVNWRYNLNLTDKS